MIATRWNPLGRSGKPYAYEVEYLESTGTQYIDTGVECTGDLSVEFATMVLTYDNLSNCGGIHLTRPYFRHHCTVYNNSTYWLQYDADEGASISASIGLNVKIEISVDAVNGIALVNGKEILFDPVDATKTTGRCYGIFARIANDGSIQGRPSRFWFFKMSRGGVLLRDFIPVVDRDGVACMYDKVTKKLFYNQGTGKFIAGPKVIPVGNVSAKSYIQDGLIAQWDGIENVGYGQHDSNATVWKDLVGNCDAVLQDATFSDNALTMSTATDVDKIGAIIQNLDTAPFEIDEGAFYLEITLKAKKSSNTWTTANILSLGKISFGLSHNFGITGRVDIYPSSSTNFQPYTTSTATPAIGEHFNLGIPIGYTSVWGDKETAFGANALINGDVYTSWGYASSGASRGLGQFLYCPKNTANWAFEIQRISIYREINLERTQHNLAIDKERFGISL